MTRQIAGMKITVIAEEDRRSPHGSPHGSSYLSRGLVGDAVILNGKKLFESVGDPNELTSNEVDWLLSASAVLLGHPDLVVTPELQAELVARWPATAEVLRSAPAGLWSSSSGATHLQVWATSTYSKLGADCRYLHSWELVFDPQKGFTSQEKREYAGGADEEGRTCGRALPRTTLDVAPRD